MNAESRYSVCDNSDIDDLLAGRRPNPETGEVVPIPIRLIRIERSLAGAEADLVAASGLACGRLALVADSNTYPALGRRVATALRQAGRAVDDVVLEDPHADTEWVDRVAGRTRHADALVAVGSGTVNDLVKYASFQDGRDYVVFATAASMNGYTSTTAAITEHGFKKSLPAHGPLGIFMDLEVIAAAPVALTRSGLGDSLCRTTAQVDWRLSQALLGTPYHEAPFLLQAGDEAPLLDLAGGLDKGDLEAVARLCRILTFCGLGAVYTGTSHHGSMSEHMVSHYIDMFAGAGHPGTLHGHQVGIATLSMSRLQHRILGAGIPPVLAPTRIDPADLERRYGSAMAVNCLREWRAKALDERQAEWLNGRLAANWAEFTRPLREVMLPTRRLSDALQACGGYTTAEQAGLPVALYREALVHAREIRNRFSILDIAGDAGLLAAFAAGEH